MRRGHPAVLWHRQRDDVYRSRRAVLGDDVVACGNTGQACCQGNGTANNCLAGRSCQAGDGGMTCQLCGADGQACCPGNACNTGLGCANPPGTGPNVCMNCGAVGMACCPGDTCQGTAICEAGADGGMTCAACGAAGQPCCASGGGGAGTCNSGLVCNNPPGAPPAMCEACGGMGQPCCGGAAANACGTGLSCQTVGDGGGAEACEPCGASGQNCCAGNTCSAGLGCANPPGTGPNVCMNCGQVGFGVLPRATSARAAARAPVAATTPA